MNDLIVVPQKNQWQKLKALVLDSVSSPITRRVYNLGLDEFFELVRPGAAARLHQGHRERLARSSGGPRARVDLDQRADHGRPQAGGRGGRQRAAGARAGCRDHARIKGVKSKGVRLGNWLSMRQAQTLLNTPDVTTKKGLRDRAILAVLLGCGLRRSEVAALTFGHIQQRDGRWCIVDLVGKHGRVRTVPMPTWTKVAIDGWTSAVGLTGGSRIPASEPRRPSPGEQH